MTDKAIITNITGLHRKYGNRLSDVKDAIEDLIEADAGRGVSSKLVPLDDAVIMADLNLPPVSDTTDPAEVKEAVDGIYRALVPDYLCLLGSVDIIPQQPMQNPLFSFLSRDPDRYAFGDLPYACEAPHDDDPRSFIGPTRVVGRLPDITNASSPEPLLKALRTAANWQPRPIDDYLACLGMSAAVWRESTSLTLKSLIGSDQDLRLSPAEGPQWEASLVGRLSHFINCHGASEDPHFFGELDDDFPVAHDAAYIADKLVEGTVAAAECCYGAQLYDPGESPPGICNTYLGAGAYGFFGSSTIAYGPKEGNGAADLICQYFLRHVLAGASLGRATLEARQEFITTTPVLDPVDLKTLAQFSLMGDPSIHPVAPQREEILVSPPQGDGRDLPREARSMLAGRSARRRNLRTVGVSLKDSTSVARPAARSDVAHSKEEILRLSDVRLPETETLSFRVEPPALEDRKGEEVGALAPRPDAMQVLIGQQGEVGDAATPQVVAVVADLSNGDIVGLRRLFSK